MCTANNYLIHEGRRAHARAANINWFIFHGEEYREWIIRQKSIIFPELKLNHNMKLFNSPQERRRARALARTRAALGPHETPPTIARRHAACEPRSVKKKRKLFPFNTFLL